MAADRFKNAENEYFRLKGLLDAKRITQEQFEDGLRQLTIQDAQGRTWMLGVDDGKWYVHDGRSWVQAEPYPASAPNVPFMPAPAAIPAPPPRSPGSTPIYVVGSVVVACLLCIVSIGLAVGLGILNIEVGKPTAVARPILPLLLPTFVPQTYAPLATLAAPTLFASASPTGTLALPIETPTVTPTVTVTVTLPTATPTMSPTLPPPGVYVANLRLEPAPPMRRQDVGFYPTFLNTTGSTQSYRWLVYVYRPDNFQHSFGETPKITTDLPVGSSEQRAGGTWKLTGGGDCEDFVARVAWLDQERRVFPFNQPEGRVFELPFAVCP